MTLEIQAIRGVTKNYGARTSDMTQGGRVDSENLTKMASWTFDYDELPAGATHNLGLSIPANSTITGAWLRVITAFTSTGAATDLTVGLEQADGTDIDVNGLLTAVHLDQTTLQVEGARYDGSSGTAGELIGFTIGAAAGELVVIPSVDDLLTGRAEVIVEYMTPAALPA